METYKPTFTFFFTEKIYFEIDDKNHLYDYSQGEVDKGKVLKDLVSPFIALSDEAIINALKDLKSLYHSNERVDESPICFRLYGEIMNRLGVVAFNASCRTIDGAIQITRQLLTNAFAIKRGLRIDEIKLLSLQEDDMMYISELFNSALSIYEESRQMPLSTELIEKFSDNNLNLFEGSENYIFLSNSQKRFIAAFSRSMANSLALQLDFVGNYSRVLHGMVEGMKKKYQMPPYGISLALDWEDEGQDMLPWLDDIPETKKMEYRQAMHEYANGMATRVYDAILAAYCCYLFVDVPQFPQVEKEFSEVNLLKGKYSERKVKLDFSALKTLHRKFEGDESQMEARLKNTCSPLYDFFKVLIKIKKNF